MSENDYLYLHGKPPPLSPASQQAERERLPDGSPSDAVSTVAPMSWLIAGLFRAALLSEIYSIESFTIK